MIQASRICTGPLLAGVLKGFEELYAQRRIEHMPPHRHPVFYSAQRFTLNVTRAEMTAAGWSPSVRLFEAAACGVPIVTDAWPGLDEFFHPGSEILIVDDSEDVVSAITDLPEERRRAIGEAARLRVLANHTAACRARRLQPRTWTGLLPRSASIPRPRNGKAAASQP